MTNMHPEFALLLVTGEKQTRYLSPLIFSPFSVEYMHRQKFIRSIEIHV